MTGREEITACEPIRFVPLTYFEQKRRLGFHQVEAVEQL
jgi:hypothetical protein